MTVLAVAVDLEPVNWRRYARCLGVDPNVFYPSREDPNEATQKAREICHGCPVWESCLEEAIAANEPAGIWGGLTYDERRAIRRRRRLARLKAQG